MFSCLSSCLTLGACDFVSPLAGFSVFLDSACLVSWPVGVARRVCLGEEAGSRGCRGQVGARVGGGWLVVGCSGGCSGGGDRQGGRLTHHRTAVCSGCDLGDVDLLCKTGAICIINLEAELEFTAQVEKFACNDERSLSLPPSWGAAVFQPSRREERNPRGGKPKPLHHGWRNALKSASRYVSFVCQRSLARSLFRSCRRGCKDGRVATPPIPGVCVAQEDHPALKIVYSERLAIKAAARYIQSSGWQQFDSRSGALELQYASVFNIASFNAQGTNHVHMRHEINAWIKSSSVLLAAIQETKNSSNSYCRMDDLHWFYSSAVRASDLDKRQTETGWGGDSGRATKELSGASWCCVGLSESHAGGDVGNSPCLQPHYLGEV